MEDFEALNPGVSCPNLTPGQSYCVIGTVSNDPEPTTTSTTMKTTTSTSTTSSSPYQPTQPGLVANCDQFHLVASGDQCDTIEAKYGITDAQFKAWNPSINAQCTNLWLDYYVCVHVPGATTTSPPQPTPTGPEPQMPGIVSNCAKFYQVKSGDSCWSIDNAAGITLAQFRSWNTQIDESCTNLWVDYYVCIGV
jgi:LysM repeat protein